MKVVTIMQKYNKSKTSAFTIIELIVIVIVIGILSSIVFVSYNNISKKGRIAAIESNLENTSKQLQVYGTKYGYYPSTISENCIASPTDTTNLCLESGTDNTINTFPYRSVNDNNGFILTETDNELSYYITETTTPKVVVGTFVKAYGDSGSEVAKDLALASDGTTISTGYTTSYGTGDKDIFISKTDINGNVIWFKTWGGIADEEAESIAVSEDGSFVISGDTFSYGNGDSESVIIKFNSNGDLLWNRTWGNSNWDSTGDIVITNDNGYAFTGQTNISGAGNADAFIARFDTNGTLLWTRTWGGTNNENAWNLTETKDGSLIISSHTYGFGSVTKNQGMIAKFSSNGTLQWNRLWGNSSIGHTFLGDIIEDEVGNIYVTGSTRIFGDGTESGLLLIKYTADGTFLWDKVYTHGEMIVPASAMLTLDNNITIVGYAGIDVADSNTINSFIVKFDQSGNLLLNKSVKYNTVGLAYGLNQSIDGNIILAGSKFNPDTSNVDASISRYYFDGTINNCDATICSSLSITQIYPTIIKSNPTATVTSPNVTSTSPSVTLEEHNPDEFTYIAQ